MTDDLDVKSGANGGLTLREARANFITVGACCPEMVAHVVPIEERQQFLHRPRKIAGADGDQRHR